jgi:hypothetical protein
MSSWHSYSSIFALGHRAVADLLKGPVLVEEKVDGSLFAFGRFGEVAADGVMEEFTLKCRSKGAQLQIGAPEKMFGNAVQNAVGRRDVLHPNWTYYGEYLQKPKHNALAYDRTPAGCIIIFDIATDDMTFLGYVEKNAEAARISLECVPLLYQGMVTDLQQFRALLDTTSVLGGQKIEGVVVKPVNYDIFGQDKKVLMGKFVSEAYKEVHAREWKVENPTSGDILERLGESLRTPARWHKAIQHLKERGELEGSPKDIGALMREVPGDVLKEEEEMIKGKLMEWAWPHLRRKVVAGLPEWYKEWLLAQQFEEEGTHE